ncbi:hypothetical protein [Litorilituus lipolyticus]|uniref:Uncharacterized protein n=1 Tax=Litorilituus lipolyticus TaxID=2491017 RepID=A0A502KU58_9GAMM|nr:hypothetical protein [Litorilituus lipolyticus]TPH13939.1 hypothetical protein EPA86_12545 [Litorilituus lipolyticus]
METVKGILSLFLLIGLVGSLPKCMSLKEDPNIERLRVDVCLHWKGKKWGESIVRAQVKDETCLAWYADIYPESEMGKYRAKLNKENE